jgi:hypothetical protein
LKQHEPEIEKMTEYLDAQTALNLMNATVAIQEAIATTNNGKLMICRIENPAHRLAVPALIEMGVLAKATFLSTGDAVRLA